MQVVRMSVVVGRDVNGHVYDYGVLTCLNESTDTSVGTVVDIKVPSELFSTFCDDGCCLPDMLGYDVCVVGFAPFESIEFSHHCIVLHGSKKCKRGEKV